MERQESQRIQIQKWLNEGHFITPIMALQLFGCFRLSAVIYILKYNYGMNIETEIVYEENGKHHAKYYLKK
jgi:hypothetical protein